MNGPISRLISLVRNLSQHESEFCHGLEEEFIFHSRNICLPHMSNPFHGPQKHWLLRSAFNAVWDWLKRNKLAQAVTLLLRIWKTAGSKFNLDTRPYWLKNFLVLFSLSTQIICYFEIGHDHFHSSSCYRTPGGKIHRILLCWRPVLDETIFQNEQMILFRIL
jgi:hypothetical protein